MIPFSRIRVFAACLLGATLLMCNVWTSLSNCTTDAECTNSQRCEVTVQRCVPRTATTNDGGALQDASPDVGTLIDGGLDGGRHCETLPWGKPKLVRGLEHTEIVGARLSPDELSMVLTKGDPIGADNVISTASRQTTSDPFTLDGPIPKVNAPTSALWPTMTADGLLLFFESDRIPLDAGSYGRGGIRIWSSKRVNKLDEFSEPNLQKLFDVPVSAEASETAPYVHPTGNALYFASSARPGHGGLDIYVAKINGAGAVSEISNIDNVNTSTFENAPVVTLDDKYLYHARYTTEGVTHNHIYMASRATPTDKFGASTLVAALNSDYDDYPSWVAPDHCRMYIASTRLDDSDDAGQSPMFRVWYADRIFP